MRGFSAALLLCLLCCLVVGCRKKAPAQEPAPPTVATEAAPPVSGNAPAEAAPSDLRPLATPAKPLPPPPPTVAARADNYVRMRIDGEVDAFLTGELHRFIAEKKRFPESFAEFTGARLDSIPRPPEGKRWVIDAESIQVKAVKMQ